MKRRPETGGAGTRSANGFPGPRLADDDTAKVALLSADIGQLVRYTDTAVGVNFTGNQKAGAYLDDWFYIEAIKTDVPPDWAGNLFSCSVTLIPSYIYRNLDAIAYDLFTRADATGALGTSLSGDAWANDSGFNIVSNAAKPNSTSVQTPNINLGVTDGVAEVRLAGMAS